MFQGKRKAITFSYDDGVLQDKRLIKLFNKYGLKCTFNLNSQLLGKAGMLVREEVSVAHCKPREIEVADIYRGHEIAAHTLTHPQLDTLEDAEILRQIEEDRSNLSALSGSKTYGMAYPCRTPDKLDHIVALLKKNSDIGYARTTKSTYSFDLPKEPLALHPTVHHTEWEKMYALADEFLSLTPDAPKLFYIWGHSYEFDIDDSWNKFEEFLKYISGKEDIFYGTNCECLIENM